MNGSVSFIHNRWDINSFICQKYLIFKIQISPKRQSLIIIQHIHIKEKRAVRRKQQQWSTSFVCPTHLFFLFTEPFVNVTFSIQPIHQYLVQYFNRYRYISSEQNHAMTKNFSLWSNKVNQKPDRGDHCWSNHSLTEVQRNKYGDLLTYVCFNEFFDLDQLWCLMLVENHVCVDKLASSCIRHDLHKLPLKPCWFDRVL